MGKWQGKTLETSVQHKEPGNEGMLRVGERVFPREETLTRHPKPTQVSPDNIHKLHDTNWAAYS